MKKLKEFLIKRKIDQAQKNRKEGSFVSFKKANLIAILYEASNGIIPHVVLSLCNTLIKQHNKQVVAFAWVDNHDNKIPTHQYSTFFFTHELSWLSLPKKEFMQTYQSIHPDIFIDLTKTEIPCLQYLIASSPAKLKLAYRSQAHPFLDLTIAPSQGADNIEELILYLQKINP